MESQKKLENRVWSSAKSEKVFKKSFWKDIKLAATLAVTALTLGLGSKYILVPEYKNIKRDFVVNAVVDGLGAGYLIREAMKNRKRYREDPSGFMKKNYNVAIGQA